MVWAHHGIDSQFAHSSLVAPMSDSTPLPGRTAIKLAKPAGFNRLEADLYWLAFIQYAGDAQARRADKWSQADKFVDVITALDPQFVQAYWFAAFTVGADQGRPDLAAEIIKRGIDANPGNWYLPYIAGINQFLYAHNDREAAKYYEQAAALPGAPQYIAEQAQILRSGAPGLVNAARTLESIYRHAKEPLVSERARRDAILKWQQVAKAAPNNAYRDAARAALTRLDGGSDNTR